MFEVQSMKFKDILDIPHLCINKPITYLLDEPSAALDKETEQFIIENFSKFVLENKKQLIMVTLFIELYIANEIIIKIIEEVSHQLGLLKTNINT